MKKFLIGSSALKKLYPNFKRTPKDIDFLVETKLPADRNSDIRIEYHENKILYDYLTSNNLEEVNGDILLTLKCSHIFWDIFWDKHMFDIVFLFENGNKLIKPLFEELYSYWNIFHSKNKRSNLQMSAEDFFNNALKTYDHDYLHTLITPIPTFTKILKDGAEVEVDENKFNLLSYEDKLNTVREEVYVMAYERLGRRNYKEAYCWMLKKFIREHAPMFQAIFILENFRELHLPKINYKQIIDEKLKN